MIRIYWPGKAVPVWLNEITLDGKPGNQYATHKGFGVIAKMHGRFYVWNCSGYFMWIRGNHGMVSVKAGGKGVLVCFRFVPFIRELMR